MTAKFDAKRARENMWVTHQNLARAKGGRPGYQFKERKAPGPPPRFVVTIGGAAPASTSGTAGDAGTSGEPDSSDPTT